MIKVNYWSLGVLGLCSMFTLNLDGEDRERTPHELMGWKAEDYFEDRKVVALCKAIEADDVTELDRIVKEGADVNAKGKGNMTPLLWAFPGGKLDRFKRILEHGANPNVLITSDLGTKGQVFLPGMSVTHMACDTGFDGFWTMEATQIW